MSPNCTHPFCTLIEANAQICGVCVSLDTSDSVASIVDNPYPNMCDHVKRSLAMLAVIASQNNVPIGHNWHEDGDSRYSLNVYRKNHTEYEVCFHVKESTEEGASN